MESTLNVGKYFVHHQQESMSRQDKFCICLDKVRFILTF